MLDVFYGVDFNYYVNDKRTKNKIDEFGVSEMIANKMMIKTRPRYPSDKLSFTIANITKDKPIRWLNIFFSLNEQFDVDLVLENSQRNLLSSFIYICIYFFYVFSLKIKSFEAHIVMFKLY